MYVIGVDPGPIPGVARLHLSATSTRRLFAADALQCTPDVLLDVLDALSREDLTAVAVERFVVGGRAARASTPRAGERTRSMVGEVESWARERGLYGLRQHAAAMVKPWATDERLEAAGLMEPTKGMRHARDAARHALYAAVSAYGLPDPLSKAGAR